MDIDTISRCCAQCGVRSLGMCAWSGCQCHHRAVQAAISAEIDEMREHDEHDENCACIYETSYYDDEQGADQWAA